MESPLPDNVPPGYLSREDVAHLMTRTDDGLCWWCQTREATTAEHKYKHSDLKVLLYGGDGELTHLTENGGRPITLRGKGALKRDRYRVVKFDKSMCAECNNARSQPFDRAYDTYADAVRRHPRAFTSTVDIPALYGEAWETEARNLARYFIKHFGCRLIRCDLPVPPVMRDFLDGSPTMPDVGLSFIHNDEVARGGGELTLSPDLFFLSDDHTCIRHVVMASYIGPLGVRFCWQPGAGNVDSSQFFNYPRPRVHQFKDAAAVESGHAQPRRSLARF